MLTTLSLKRAPAALRDPIAWFLPGDDASTWLEEVAHWPVATDDLEFYLVAGDDHTNPAGVLVIPPIGTRIPRGGRAQPFGCLAAGCFLPVDAFVWPPVMPEELRAAAKSRVLVFHPAYGLTGFDEADCKRVWDLINPPRVESGEIWNAARPGPLPQPAMGAIRLVGEISLDDIFGEESAEIGSKAPEALLPLPDEPGTGLGSQVADGAATLLVKALLGITSLLPRTASAPTWVNAVENWAQSKLAGVTRELERRRHRELHRLLGLLASNPEEGLRHAIPLAALLHRGRARASAQLGRRSLDFNLGRLGGGGAADFWDVPAELRSSLSKSYREAAMREMKLGRHRRAACIFAELLGDFEAAADALKQGRHYHEAALLYRDRLNNPLSAATCFAEGGLIVEALAIYEKHDRWLDAADLHARLGDRSGERTAVRRAIDTARGAGDLVGAARLIETRLDAPDEALALLAAAWPGTSQAFVCLEERMAMLERTKRHDETRRLVAELAAEKTALPLLASLTGLLAKTFETASDPRVRHAAADAARVKASAGLALLLFDKAEELAVLRALIRLAPEDRLLSRDTQRFRQTRSKAIVAATPRAAGAAHVRQLTPEKGGGINLPRIGVWSRVSADAAGFYAVAHTPAQKVFFSRGTWSHELQSIDWPDPASSHGSLFLMTCLGGVVFLMRPFAPGLVPKVLPMTDRFNRVLCRVGTPTWLPQDTVQMAASPSGLWVVRVVGPRIVLESFEGDRRLDSRDVTDELVAAGATGGGTSLVLDARGSPGHVALGYGQHLLVRNPSSELMVSDLGARIIGLLPALPRTPGWVVLLERGAVFVPAGKIPIVARPLDDDLEMPRGVFLGDERLVLVGGEKGVVARLEPGEATRTGWFSLPGGAGVAVTRAGHPREFAVFTASGAAQRWHLPP